MYPNEVENLIDYEDVDEQTKKKLIEVENLINFIRGVDTYDQDADNNKTESIHKLADIYHSEVIVVGIPEASTQDTGAGNFTKTDAYYRSQKQYNNFKKKIYKSINFLKNQLNS